jgi:hypothetical protein
MEDLNWRGNKDVKFQILLFFCHLCQCDAIFFSLLNYVINMHFNYVKVPEAPKGCLHEDPPRPIGGGMPKCAVLGSGGIGRGAKATDSVTNTRYSMSS